MRQLSTQGIFVFSAMVRGCSRSRSRSPRRNASRLPSHRARRRRHRVRRRGVLRPLFHHPDAQQLECPQDFFVVPQNMIAVPRNVIVVPQNMIAQNMIAAPQKNDSSAGAFGLPSSACPTAAYSFGAFAAKLTPPATPFSHRTLLRCPMLAGMRRRRSTACSSAAQRSPRFQKAGPPGEGPPPSQKLG